MKMTGRPDCDVLIVGSGIMGAAVAQLLREDDPETTIIMFDGGPVLGSRAGQHLHDAPDDEIRAEFAQRAARGNQSLYIGAARSVDLGAELTRTEPGMHSVSAFGSDSADMPGTSLAWNVGGMGVHWSAATPWPFADEVVDFIPTDEWDADLVTAQRLLKVHPSAFGSTPAGDIVIDALNEVFGDMSVEGRRVQPMPMAITESATGRLLRTGPSSIFPPMGESDDACFELRPHTLVTQVLYDGPTARGVRVRDVLTGEESEVYARVVIVCADTLRTPQLLWASGIRPPALGRYLNEHAFLMGKVTVDTERLGIDQIPHPRPGEWSTSATWLPTSGSRQPFHGQFMQSPLQQNDDDNATGYAVVLALYVPTEITESNRVEFSDDETDLSGLPRMTIHFRYSQADLELIELARSRQLAAGRRLGAFDPEKDSKLLDPGSSLHYTGTVRMGMTEDGTSVCDPDCRVWSFDNLYVAGNGVIPTALACNSTLTSMISAVRAARSISGLLKRNV